MLHLKYLFSEEGYKNNLKFIIKINFESLELSYDFNRSIQSFSLLKHPMLNIFLSMIKKAAKLESS